MEKTVGVSPHMAQAIYLLNPHNADFVEGRASVWRDPRRHETFGLAMACVAAVGMLLGLYWAFSFRSISQRHQLEEEGISTIGEIKEIYPCNSSSSQVETQCMRYTYQTRANSHTAYEGKQEIPPALYKTATVGDKIGVYYLPDDPSTSGLSQYPDEPLFTNRALIQVALLVAFGMGVFFALRQLLIMNNEALANGKLIDGTIRSHQLKRTKYGPYLHVQYELTSPTTGHLLKSSQRFKWDSEREFMPFAGAPIKVLYLNDSRHQAM